MGNPKGIMANTTDLAGNAETLSTLPLSLLIGASALVIAPAGFFMRKYSYKSIFICGAGMGVISGVSCAGAMYLEDKLWAITLLSAGVVPQGFAYGIAHYYRHVATVISPSDKTTKYMAIVITGGTLAGVAGPGLVSLTHSLWLKPFALTYALLALLNLVQLVALLFTRISEQAPPQLFVQPDSEQDNNEESVSCSKAKKDRSLLRLIFSLSYSYSVLNATVAHATMVMIMAITPIVLVNRISIALINLIIQMHVIAMYLPSYAIGNVIGLLGYRVVIICGLIIISAGYAVYLFDTYATVMVGMIFVGLGWNFSFMGSTVSLRKSYELSEKFKAQACNDTIIFGTGAVLTLLAGPIYVKAGLNVMLIGSIVASVIMFLFDVVCTSLVWKFQHF